MPRRWRMPVTACSKWLVALDGYAVPRAGLRKIVPKSHVLGASVVPEGDRIRLPAKPHLKFRPGAMVDQVGENGLAFLPGQIIDPGREHPVDVQPLAPCLRV